MEKKLRKADVEMSCSKPVFRTKVIRNKKLESVHSMLSQIQQCPYSVVHTIHIQMSVQSLVQIQQFGTLV